MKSWKKLEKVDNSWNKWGKVGKMAKSGEKRPFWIWMSVATSNMKLIGAFLIKL